VDVERIWIFLGLLIIGMLRYFAIGGWEILFPYDERQFLGQLHAQTTDAPFYPDPGGDSGGRNVNCVDFQARQPTIGVVMAAGKQ